MPIHPNDMADLRRGLKIDPPAPLPECAIRLYDELKAIQACYTVATLPNAVMLMLVRDIRREMAKEAAAAPPAPAQATEPAAEEAATKPEAEKPAKPAKNAKPVAA